jgi:metal-responsive CopG/Arc/MetJ family transcriptional regulator
MKTKQADAVVPVRIPRSLLNHIDSMAHDEDRSRSYIIRKLLESAIEKAAKKGKQ